jgi:hypothetical protein
MDLNLNQPALSLRVFFLPTLADRRSATGQTESRAENRTDFIPISAKALMPLAAGSDSPIAGVSLGYRWLSRENICLAQTICRCRIM